MKNNRRHRRLLRMWTCIFAFLVIVSPFIVIADAVPQPVVSDYSIFGLHPELVKGVFYLLLLIVSFFLTRTLVRVDKNQSILFDNQRKLAMTITALVTAHNINHKQSIEQPNLSDSGGGG